MYKRQLSDYDVEIDPDKVYTVEIGEKTEIWPESKLWEFMVSSDCKLETLKTVIGNQEFVHFPSKGSIPPENFHLTITGPGSDCKCQDFNFPVISIKQD